MNFLRRDKGKRKAEKVLKVLRACNSTISAEFYAPDGEYAKKILKARKPCSCPMCGNPRKYEKGKNGLTVQERRELDAD